MVIAKRVPVAAYCCKSNITYSYMNRQVIRRVEKIAYAVCDALERRGVAGFVPPSSWTIWELKMGTYGPVSFRHLAVEAGRGTRGRLEPCWSPVEPLEKSRTVRSGRVLSRRRPRAPALLETGAPPRRQSKTTPDPCRLV